jgi:hypothetical protein
MNCWYTKRGCRAFAEVKSMNTEDTEETPRSGRKWERSFTRLGAKPLDTG